MGQKSEGHTKQGSGGSKLTLLLDVDGVLFDFDNWFRRLGSFVVGRDLKVINDVYEMQQRYNLDAWEWVKIRDVLKTAKPRLELMPGVTVGLIEKLMEAYEVYFVTSPHWGIDGWCEYRRMVFEDMIPGTASRLIFCEMKHVVRGDIFIDDCPWHLKRWKECNPDGRTVLIGSGYGAGVSGMEIWYCFAALVHHLTEGLNE